MDCLWFIVVLLVLGAVGWVIDLIVPGKMPMGWLGGVIAAIVGGLFAGWLFSLFGGSASWGPSITWSGWTLYIIPAIIGGVILGFIVRFVMGMLNRGGTTGA
jgi:uncharacterized membrane protein YeaQ/YmgE (transglycosylase-associated protein family)